jgi:hypothetical protein
MHVPTESWMEIFKWLEQPAQIENISLVNYWFYDIIYTNLAKKYEKKQHRKKMPDLRFYRGCGGIAKLCELGTNRSFPIAEVPPPEYIQPFNRIDVQYDFNIKKLLQILISAYIYSIRIIFSLCPNVRTQSWLFHNYTAFRIL